MCQTFVVNLSVRGMMLVVLIVGAASVLLNSTKCRGSQVTQTLPTSAASLGLVKALFLEP